MMGTTNLVRDGESGQQIWYNKAEVLLSLAGAVFEHRNRHCF